MEAVERQAGLVGQDDEVAQGEAQWLGVEGLAVAGVPTAINLPGDLVKIRTL
jgi:hypothetical protein